MGPPRRPQFYYDLPAGELYAACIRYTTAKKEMLMKRFHLIARYSLVLLVLFATTVSLVQSQTANRPRRIAVFGSSVANGTGDEFNKEGYTGLLRELLSARGWEVLNQSRGGDTTKTMAPRFAPQGTPDPNVRYLLPVNPGYVVIGLSLANEGIWEANTTANKEAVFKQYADGITGFIDRSRQNNIVPVVALVYPRMVYTTVEYEYVRKMNLLQNTWDVPTVNVLGATDDGTGRYAKGFDFDDKHPNAAGHREFFYAFVPSLFDALEKGKPTPAAPSGARGFARITEGVAPLRFDTPDTMHPFAVSFFVRTQTDGTIAAISGSTLTGKSETKKGGRGGTVEFESMTLSPDRPFNAAIAVQNGKFTYRSANGTVVPSEAAADSRWHHVVLSHYTARGETLFYIDGKLAGKFEERLQPKGFTVGGSGSSENGSAPKQADYRDVFLFRSALNSDEVAALHNGKILQASLEIYAPLNDAQFRQDMTVENRAQSLSAFKVGSGRIVHIAESSVR
jgi:lysophospholipase L1-like esterase